MKTVDEILDAVYGGKPQAAIALKKKRTAPWNWRTRGFFPKAVAFAILEDASKKGLMLALSDIPVGSFGDQAAEGEVAA